MVHRLTSSTIVAAFLSLAATSVFAADAGAISQQSSDQWRASKLAGVEVYGPNNRTVGKITDVLMSKDGKAQYVIIGVGGFLGLGEKDVAIPYDQVKFTNEPMMPPANPEPVNNNMAAPAANNSMASGAAKTAPNAMAGGMATNGAAATTTGLGTPADTMGMTAAPGMSGSNGMPGMAHSMAYPDHGTIDMTADQLKAAPTFKFAS